MVIDMHSDSVDIVDREELEHFSDLARRFSAGVILPMFDGEHADGDFTLLSDVFDAALDLGLAASPIDGMPGHDFGVWGRASSQSRKASMLLLGIIAETCGGVAMALNMQGAATNIILCSGKLLPFEARRPSLGLQEGPWPPGWNALCGMGMETAALADGDGFIINGKKSFCYGMGGTDAWIVFARLGDELACFAVPAGEKGIIVSDHGPRTGLRACAVMRVEFRDVRVPASARLDGGDGRGLALRALTLSWLGMASIAAGIARGSLAAAKKYAGERYQGGAIITHHPIIKKLIGGAETRLHATEASLGACVIDKGNAGAEVRSALMLKHSACALCGEAVSDCLQVFGGYGYMEDFGMEKRLRDIAALGCTLGSPVYAEQFIGESAEVR
jgi:alkylation response protein AidB-like acyl-CoA dehydrogenase